MMSDHSTQLPLRAEGLVKRYGDEQQVTALEDVSLTLARGEMLAIIGASGSGKSTLLHLLAGLTTPSAGGVWVDGQELSGMSDRQLTLFRRRKVGLVFQAFNLIPTLSAEDNLTIPLLLDRTGAVPVEKVNALLETLGLSHRRRHYPDQLSGGEQQRVAIGRALVNDPSVILADEPTGNLDSTNGQRLCDLMRDLCRTQDRSIVLVTHDPAVAAYADRVLVLRDGRLVQEVQTASCDGARGLAERMLESFGPTPTEVTACG